MGKNPGFRAWFYFRQGWSTYFAFIFAAVNTLTVTYYLAIENYPFLQGIFPTFEQYIVIIAFVGVPILVGVGYAHYKKTPSYRAETDVWMESNPYQARVLLNSQFSVNLNLKMIKMIVRTIILIIFIIFIVFIILSTFRWIDQSIHVPVDRMIKMI